MRVTASRVYSRPPPVPKMPPGLVELMEGLTRDVLKNNPPDVYEFCADHMRKLLEIRDGPSPNKKLSLEQKIIRAQEKVRKRAEQRWQQYKRELKEDKVTEIAPDNNSPPSTVPDNNTPPSTVPDNNTLPSIVPDNNSQVSVVPDNNSQASVVPDNNSPPSTVLDNNALPSIDKPQASVVPDNNSQASVVPDKIAQISVAPDNTSQASVVPDNNSQLSAVPDNNSQLSDVPDNNSRLSVVPDNNSQLSVVPDNNSQLSAVPDNNSQLTLVPENNSQPGVVPDNNSQHSIENIDDKQSALKLLHHEDDFIKTSEIEISYKPGNNAAQEEQLENVVAAVSITEKNSAPVMTSPLPPEEPFLRNEIIESVLATPSLEDEKQQVSNDHNLGIGSLKIEESHNLTLENDDDKFVPAISDHQNEDVTNKCQENIEDEKKANTIVTADDSEQDSLNRVGVAEKTEVQENRVVKLEEIDNQSSIGTEDASSLPLSDYKVEVTQPSVDEFEDVNDDKSIISSTRNIIDVKNVISRLSTPENMLTADNEVKSNDNEKKSFLDVTEATAISDNTEDLEKVLNDAVENIKRKDSSAYDSIKDSNVLNEEESDASDTSNYADNNVFSLQPVEDNNKTFDNKVLQTDSVIENNEKASHIEFKRENVQENAENDPTDMNLNKESDTGDTQGHVANEMTSKDFGEAQRPDNANNGMDLETAAVTIQKVFRTFLFKSRASTFDENVNDENNMSDEEEKKDEGQFLPTNMNIERRPLARMDTVLQTVNEEKSLSLSTDDSSLSSAATIIQAHVRGFLVRNKLHSSRTTGSNSLAISNETSRTSVDGDTDQNKNKTILNIHIVPEGGNYLSRDESMITSMDLSMDASPPSSVNLHPLGYNTSERRKQLKREDAIQSVSPPSNNSGKLSEDVDSVKEMTINGNDTNTASHDEKVTMASLLKDDTHQETEGGSLDTTPTNSLTVETVLEDNKTSNTDVLSSPDPEPSTKSPDKNKKSLTKQSSDEMDVVTPFKENSYTKDETQLLHSGEFHDAALPTKVSRSDTPVVSEFKNVLVYFIIWNN